MVYPYFDFNNFFMLAEQLGVFTVLLPFLLIFAVIYSTLLRIKIFERVPAANVIVSLVIAFFALTNYWISYYMQRLFSNLAIAIIIFLAIIILFGLVNIDVSEGKVKWFSITVIIIAIIILIIKTFSPQLEFSLLPYLQFIIPFAIILIGVILIALFTKPEQGESWGEQLLKKIFEGGKGKKEEGS